MKYKVMLLFSLLTFAPLCAAGGTSDDESERIPLIDHEGYAQELQHKLLQQIRDEVGDTGNNADLYDNLRIQFQEQLAAQKEHVGARQFATILDGLITEQSPVPTRSGPLQDIAALRNMGANPELLKQYFALKMREIEIREREVAAQEGAGQLAREQFAHQVQEDAGDGRIDEARLKMDQEMASFRRAQARKTFWWTVLCGAGSAGLTAGGFLLAHGGLCP